VAKLGKSQDYKNLKKRKKLELELYYNVAAKRLDCDNTVHAYTIQYNTM